MRQPRSVRRQGCRSSSRDRWRLVVDARHASNQRISRCGGSTFWRLNRLLGRRGKLFADRYHERILKTPREVRNALRYVLLNARHHLPDGGALLGGTWFDPYSSCAWFTGWRRPLPLDQPWKRELAAIPRPTCAPTVWLLTVGWRQHGLIELDELVDPRQRGLA